MPSGIVSLIPEEEDQDRRQRIKGRQDAKRDLPIAAGTDISGQGRA